MIEYINYLQIQDVLKQQISIFNNEQAKEVQYFVESVPKLRNFFNISNIIPIATDFTPRSNINSNPLKRDLLDYIHIQYDVDFNKSLSELMDDRAIELQQILDNNPDKKLKVMWSGGIDSTGILVSILTNFKQSNLKRVEVCLNRTSTIEYFSFFNKFICDKFKICKTTLSLADFENSIIVDGEPGDLLFGSEYCINNYVANGKMSVMKESWKNHYDDIVESFSVKNVPTRLFDVPKNFSEWFVEQQIENIESTNIPVKSVYDFFWWVNFDNRWHARCAEKNFKYMCRDKNIEMSTQDYKQCVGSVFHFFNTKQFQNWSIVNKEKECGDMRTISDYKLPLKKYIYNYTKDSFFYQYKTKVNSNSSTSLYTFDTCFLYFKNDDIVQGINTKNIHNLKNVLKNNINL